MSVTFTTKRVLRAAIYTRCSKDKRDQRSVTEQEAECRAVVKHNRWDLVGQEVWCDNNVGASRQSRGVREQWNALIEELEAGHVDVLVVWEPSRLTRDRAVWAHLMAVCEDMGVRICTDGKLYDPADPDEAFQLDLYFCLARRETAVVRKRIRRTTAASVAEGRPHGPAAWGYRSVYDKETGRLVGRELDPVVAPVVAECFRKAAQGVPMAQLARWVEGKGLKPPRAENGLWQPSSVRKLLLKPTYIGLRTHKGKIVGKATWPPLIDEETYWAVNNILHARDRGKYRPGRARHLLSTLLRCGKCKQKMTCRKGTTGVYDYTCRYRSCMGIRQEEADAYVEAIVVNYLARPEVFSGLTAPDDAEVARARGEVERIEGEMADLNARAKAGKLSVALAAALEQSLTEQLAGARRTVDQVGVPPVLRPLIGPEAARMWDAIEEVAVRREVIRHLMELECRPQSEVTHLGPKGGVNPDRIKVTTWKLGEADQSTT